MDYDQIANEIKTKKIQQNIFDPHIQTILELQKRDVIQAEILRVLRANDSLIDAMNQRTVQSKYSRFMKSKRWMKIVEKSTGIKQEVSPVRKLEKTDVETKEKKYIETIQISDDERNRMFREKFKKRD